MTSETFNVRSRTMLALISLHPVFRVRLQKFESDKKNPFSELEFAVLFSSTLESESCRCKPSWVHDDAMLSMMRLFHEYVWRKIPNALDETSLSVKLFSCE